MIMAGGRGSRLSMGEKPLVTICDRPMIAYVIDAFASSEYEVVVVASNRTPFTKNWCRANGITLYAASGSGYIEDIAEAVTELGEEHPLFTCVSDLPCLRPDTIKTVREAYEQSDKAACSTWIPRQLCDRYGCRTQYTETVDGVEACPAGINIIHGGAIGEPQEEHRILLHDQRLAFNINTREELSAVRKFLCRDRR
jgi:adenosylcobinamide-phosphate guanylyltransferase